MTRRRPLAWIAPAVAGAILSGCTFSSGGTTEVTESGGGSSGSGSGGEAVDQLPAQPTPSVPHVSDLCDSLTAVYLSNISDTKDAATLVKDWVRVTAAAPPRLKDDLDVVGAYLVAAAKSDYATLKGASAQVGDALDHIDKYVTKTCRA